MTKKLLILTALAVMVLAITAKPTAEAAVAVAVTSPQAAAALSPGWYWVSVCSSASAVDCPPGIPHVFWFGPYASSAVCIQSRNLAGIFAQYPWTASNCFSQ